jgi:hypothetical protein
VVARVVLDTLEPAERLASVPRGIASIAGDPNVYPPSRVRLGEGPAITLAARHTKVRREGYIK